MCMWCICVCVDVYTCVCGEGNGTPLQYSCLENPMDGGAWSVAVHGVGKSRTRLSDFTFTFHFPALEKEMATHSSVLAWRIPGTGEPGGLPSLGSHRVGHDWSDLAAAAAARLLTPRCAGDIRTAQLLPWALASSCINSSPPPVRCPQTPGIPMAESLVAWGHSEPLANIQEAITDVLKTMRAAHSGLQRLFQLGSWEALAAGSDSHHHVQTSASSGTTGGPWK